MKPNEFTPDLSIILFMEGALDNDSGKMGFGLMRFSKNPIVGVIDSRFSGQTVQKVTGLPYDIPILSSLEQGFELGGKVLVLGIAPSGGRFPQEWDAAVIKCLNAGLGIINGLHDDLNQRFKAHLNHSNWIWDVRRPKLYYPIASGKAAELQNRRILLVGTDMAAGKMTTGLELYDALLSQGKSVGFVATGQIGITITGEGIPLDAIKVDHAAGAVQEAVLQHADKDYIIIEGQGSLGHPGSTATLPLMRGSQPTDLILCHKARNTHLRPPVNHVIIPDLKKFIALNEALAGACGSLCQAKTIGVALNTTGLTEAEAIEKIETIKEKTQLPTTDVVRYGVTPLLRALGC